MPAHFGSWEGTRHRSALPPPHALPFLLVVDKTDRAVLVAPWPRPFGGRLAAWQADQVEAVRALLAKAGRVPRIPWVTPPDAITALPVRPDPSWLARRLHDGHLLGVARDLRLSRAPLGPRRHQQHGDLGSWQSRGIEGRKD